MDRSMNINPAVDESGTVRNRPEFFVIPIVVCGTQAGQIMW